MVNVFMLGPLLAMAAEPAPPIQPAPALDVLIGRALEAAPALVAPERRVRAAEVRVSPAGALPDPSLGLGAQAMGLGPLGPTSAVTLELEQELPSFGKRASRRAVAEAQVHTARAELARMRSNVVTELRTLYADLYARDAEQHTLSTATQMLGLLTRTAGTRYGAGQSSREALLKIDIALARLRQRQAELTSERLALSAQVNRLTAAPPETLLGEVVALPEIDVPPRGDARLAAQSHAPELALRQAEITAGGALARAAEIDERPDFTLGLGGGVTVMREPVVMLRLGMRLPVWGASKQSRLTEAAHEELRARRGEHSDEASTVQAEVARLYAAWEAHTRVIAEYRDAIVPSAYAAFEAAQAAYVTGEADFSSVIEDFGLWLDAKTELARREAARFATWAELQRLMAPPAVALTSKEPS